MHIDYDPLVLILWGLLLVFLGIIFVMFFVRKINFANILVLLNSIQRYYLDLGFALHPFLIFSGPLLGGLLLKRNLKERVLELTRILRPIAAPAFGLVVSLFLSGLFTSIDIKSLRQYILILWIMVIECFYLLYVQNATEIMKTIKVILWYGAALASIGVVSYIVYLMGFQFIYSPREGTGLIYQDLGVEFGRLRCFDTDPNAYALYIIPMLFHAAGWGVFCKSVGKRIVLPLAVVALLFSNLILTYSRAGLLSVSVGLVLGLVIVWFTRRRIKVNMLQITIMALLTITIIIGIFLFFPSESSILNLIRTGYTFRSSFVESRFSRWENAYDLFKRNILWGVGQGNMREYYPSQAHNTWMEMLAENGIVSTFFLLWMICGLIFRGMATALKLFKENDKRGYVLLGGVIGLISMGIMMCSVSLLTASYFWFQVGYVLLLTHSLRYQRVGHSMMKNGRKDWATGEDLRTVGK